MPRPTMSDHALELLSISCTFHSKDDPGQRYTAVADTTLRIRAGEFVSVVGPTGCGKTTRWRASTRERATCSRPKR